MRGYQKALVTAVSTAVAAAITPAIAVAQESETLALEEVTVTARKRNESLLDIPVSITAYTAEQLQAAQIIDLVDLSQFSPGMNFRNQSFSVGGRWQPSIRFRGLNSGSGNPSFQVGAAFVDGIYVWGSMQNMSTFDIERVEVIKGPQNAYFGRNTFSGAVNFITREPGDEWLVQMRGGVEEFDGHTVGVAVEGPVIKDVLGMRLSAEQLTRGAQFDTSDGGELGEEESNQVNLTLVYTPTDAFKAKLRYSRMETDDGPGAIATLNSFTNPDLGNSCLTGTVPFFCGALPADRGLLDQNTRATGTLNDQLTALVNNDVAAINGFAVSPYDGNNPELQLLNKLGLNAFGIKSESERLTLELGYQFDNGYSIDFLYGDNSNDQGILRDRDNTTVSDGLLTYGVGALAFEDDSFELRLTSPQDQRFRWLVGYNRIEQQIVGGVGGGIGLSVIGNSLFNFAVPAITDVTRSELDGIFAAVSYDINDQWTVDIEARQQTDKVTNAVGTPSQRSVEFDDVAPRYILTWKPNPGTTVYASWARGLLPGTTNANLNNFNPADIAALQAEFPGAAEVIDSEELDSFEIGIKQEFDRWRYALTYYDMDWSNRKNQVFSPCVSGGPLVCLNPSGNPNDPSPNPTGQVPAVVPQEASIRGIEGDFTVQVAESLVLGATFTWIDAENGRFQSNFTAAATGEADADGKVPIEYPEQSASLYGELELPAWGGNNWYARADVLYTGKSYVDDSNQSWIDAYTQINLRGGLSGGNWRAEAYIMNATDEDGWIAGRRSTDFSTFFTAGLTQSAAVVPIRRQTFGVRVSYDLSL
jgi:iron complex outermembrane receptor protein